MVLFWALFVVAGAIYFTMMWVTLPVLLAEAGGLRPLDFRPFGYSHAEVQTYLNALSEQGVATYVGLQQQLDMVYPAILAATFIVGFRALFSRGPARLLSVVALIGAMADYAENALVWAILTQPVTVAEVNLASAFTVVKSGAGTICLLVLIGVALRYLLGRAGVIARAGASAGH